MSGHVLEVSNGIDGRRETFSPHQLPFDSVVVEGNSGTISFEAARFLAIHDIPVVFLRWDGSVLSALLPRGPVAGQLKLAQFASHNDCEKRAQIGRAILEVKLSKSVELLRFLSRFYPCDPAPVEAEVKRGPSAESIPDLMVWEGRTAAAYWVEYAKVVNRLWPGARFVTRKGRGKSWAQSATDPATESGTEGGTRHPIPPDPPPSGAPDSAEARGPRERLVPRGFWASPPVAGVVGLVPGPASGEWGNLGDLRHRMGVPANVTGLEAGRPPPTARPADLTGGRPVVAVRRWETLRLPKGGYGRLPRRIPRWKYATRPIPSG